MKKITIDTTSANQRVDKFILKYLNKSTKSFIYKMFRKKRIKLNEKRVEGNELLQIGDKITMYMSDETLDSFKEQKIINITQYLTTDDVLNIIFEDKNILLVNKPSGILSHSATANDKDTINDRVLFYLNKTGVFDISKESTFTPSICNRLDRNTTGIIIAGKNLYATQSINEAFATRQIDKFYLTIVCGEIKEAGTIKSIYKKDELTNKAILTSANNQTNLTNIPKIVETHYEPLLYKNGYTLLNVQLITGKSHQIRAHMEEIGHPIIGDTKYGDKKINKMLSYKYNLTDQLLHAHKITLTTPHKGLEYLQGKSFVAPIPDIFAKIQNELLKN